MKPGEIFAIIIVAMFLMAYGPLAMAIEYEGGALMALGIVLLPIVSIILIKKALGKEL